jgi:hypothetical protein
MINHIVLLQLKPKVDQQAIKEMYRAVCGLKEKISGIEQITYGSNNSPEKNLTRGYSEGFVVTFRDFQTRDAYLINPEHISVATKFILPIVKKVLVYDYEI